MWILTVRSPLRSPVEYEVKPGKNTLGRKPDNDIVIADESASREHAEIFCQNDLAVLYDVGSLNGTFVNRERISKPHILQLDDQIRIGQHVITVVFQENGSPPNLLAALSGTRPLTRELLLESIDQHAVFVDAVASRLTTILDLETGLSEISELTQTALGAEKCGVILADRFDQLDDLEMPASIARQAIQEHAVVIIPNLSAQEDPPKDGKIEPRIRCVLCAPVLIGKEVVAFLYAYKTNPLARPFDQHDVQLAVAISHQAALTIQRAELIEKSKVLEHLAITDNLTGLHNRRQILNIGEHEFQRAKRYQHPLAILVLDLDNLKSINDTNGHLAGDHALQTVAESVKKQLREVDAIGRFGGDEFVILLTETDLDGGLVVAERIRQCIASFPVPTDQDPIQITISIGCAAISDKSANMTELLNEADRGLIKAKKAGKNQVAVAE